jgi:hypothetical protein
MRHPTGVGGKFKRHRTMFDRYRTPVGVWFMPCRMFASHKDWISAPGIMMRLLPAADTPEYQELRRRIADITEF